MATGKELLQTAWKYIEEELGSQNPLVKNFCERSHYPLYPERLTYLSSFRSGEQKAQKKSLDTSTSAEPKWKKD